MTVRYLPNEDWFRVVRDAPLVAFDLIVRNRVGDVLLGLRENEPARGCWFTPGGAIRKNERLDDAFSRIVRSELGVELPRTAAQFYGLYEHHYDRNFLGVPDVGTHYVVLAHTLTLDGDLQPADRQHQALRWFSVPALLDDPQVHRHVKDYFPR